MFPIRLLFLLKEKTEMLSDRGAVFIPGLASVELSLQVSKLLSFPRVSVTQVLRRDSREP
jgi:hypothetical protein